MSNITFETAFENIDFSKTITNGFKNSIVNSLIADKKNKTLIADITCEKAVSFNVREKFKKEINQKFPFLDNIVLEVKLAKTDFDIQEMFENYWNIICEMISLESKICENVIKDATWKLKESKIQIYVNHNMAYFFSKRNLDKKIQELILRETNQEILVQFKNNEKDVEQINKFAREKMEQIEKIIARNTETQNKIAEEKVNKEKAIVSENVSNGVLFGKVSNEKIVPISESKEDGATVAIKGYIFNVEVREIKGEKYIVSFDITDNEDSTTIKFFIKKSIYDAELKDEFKTGKYLHVHGNSQFDTFAKEMVIMARNINKREEPPKRVDNAEEKRVELHLHTQMSSMDGVTAVKKYIQRAKDWGHKAIAITDHGVVQAFPDAMNASNKSDLKVIYGVEAYLIDDLNIVVSLDNGQNLDDTFVVFDIETTGFYKDTDGVTEIGAVKVKNGEVVDRFSTFVNPEQNISGKITQLTGITNKMVAKAPTIKEVLPEFLEFVGDSVLVAHNISFDIGFIRANAIKYLDKEVDNTTFDTVEMARCLLPDIKNHKLNTICTDLGIKLEGHHRAVNDAEATAEVFFKFVEMLKEKNVSTLAEVNSYTKDNYSYTKLRPNHCIILVKNEEGLRNLYELISMSHINYFARRPRIPKSKLIEFGNGLILGSACEAGELFRGILEYLPKKRIKEIVDFYDYLEIQPTDNNEFMIRSEKYPHIINKEQLIGFTKKIIDLGEEYKKYVVATCDVHFIEPEDKIFRKIIMAAEGFSDADHQPPLYYRTTEEMLEEFQFLGKEKAYEVVVKNTNLIADMIERILPIPDGTFPPEIDGADEELRKICMDKACSIYGDPLPDIVAERLEIELTSIINNGYAVLYIIAQKLVWKSVEDGYLVGSRGSVGSSFAANMAGITEVNSLPPHYVCGNCKYSDFTSEEVHFYAMQEACGCDMPDKNCPNCGQLLIKEGHDIPFQTFLGFEGDKEPDIDLNFSGEYQQTAHAYTEELFGTGYVFKAGTIGTLAEKTAYGFVKKYFDAKELMVHKAEINRLIGGCIGVKRTTGQHPGGLMVVPQGYSIFQFCPIQRPANDMKSTITTTHFDYHSISGRLLKLDLLGHDDPTIIRMLYDLTGINPQDVSLGDKDTMSLFESPKALGVTVEDINCQTGTLGVPEFGTKFVRGMLMDTKPQTFSDLLRISGLSHGTDVWLGNAQTLIEEGTIQLKDTISTRDGIMIYLINKGVDKKKSFKIMEKVRKGQGLTADEEEDMKACGVPDWYIWSCKKIKYMFPKAHAAAYVMMAFRIAYYKVNYPKEYYATYFTIRASDDFDYATMCYGIEKARESAKIIQQKGKEATTKEKNNLTVLELVIEFYARGFMFSPMDLYESHSSKFIVTNNGLLPPFNSLQGLGTNAAESIVVGREEGEFDTLEQLRERTSLGKSMVELLKENGVVSGIPENNQLSLFD